ncbi:MAG: NAD-dependent epimerase [Candidatus Dactylopiibacterium carminicum]|uniref:NAD(P)-dependent oxidoreductase n=1 Tax=Candidatus Dactylopiibacterium carminicum TaxID=857335 RepID=A0A272EQY1_9RHOO|nr:NAD(P)-dependent oxidoreductase [Candidatus Dactylopiibacterium carminicum]KAF7600722.1 NAD(P)-dependent oxidoreductase [Candidatus Dactylopiibacterium carminicum]PAS92481.1 MAG: NAD-dependent epimerase [Candidatus Dactylopiibacterium carminicum]PAS96051.1 MAG: NAD-dependent epimerase [Candidatus Dactylopiibacterium carminicum]PAT00728.1 MAG: NAD-dependent epimerase [Candidatus Dactylopiibacterium carminicum]
MKIVITGGTGFLGRHLVWRAAAEGAQVIFTGRDASAAREVIDHAPAGAVRWQAVAHGEADAQATLTDIAHDADALVHCAALSAPWGRREAFHRANVLGTAEVIAACQANAVPRLVHISTPSVYFGFADRLRINEDASLPTPANEYVRTKLAAEALVRKAVLPSAAILRPRALHGPWDQALVPRLLRVMRRGPIPIMRGTDIQLDLTYIDNAVDAVWLALTRPLPRPLSVYNVSNGQPATLGALLEAIAREFGLPLRTRVLPWPVAALVARGLEATARLGRGKEPLITRYSAGVLAFSQTLDVSRLRNELGWQASVSTEEGIQRHARWWKARQT